MSESLDPRLNVFRPDLADRTLADRVDATNYADGWPAEIGVGATPVRGLPDPNAGVVTFFHYGEHVQVFELGKQYSWCQSLADGYVGYVVNEAIKPVGDQGIEAYVITMGSYVYRLPDCRTKAADFLPRGALVRVDETGLVTRGIEYVRLTSGTHLPAACLSEQPPQSADIVEAAQHYIGSPYLWGGRYARGIDCSGLVQAAFSETGVNVPRDVDMQLDTIGHLLRPAGIDELQRDDLIYIPGHVVIYEGEGSIIHADGRSMMVRQERLENFLLRCNRLLSECIVRRHEAQG